MTADIYADWNVALARARLGVTPVGLDGSVTGARYTERAGVAELRAALVPPAKNP